MPSEARKHIVRWDMATTHFVDFGPRYELVAYIIFDKLLPNGLPCFLFIDTPEGQEYEGQFDSLDDALDKAWEIAQEDG